ncbi:MAG: PKD domain-containing protein [Methanomicrobiales archaeon]
MRWKTSKTALANNFPRSVIILLLVFLFCTVIAVLPVCAANTTLTISPTQTAVPATTTYGTTTSATTAVPVTTQTTSPVTSAATTSVSTTQTTIPATSHTTTTTTTASQSQSNPAVAFFADITEGPGPLDVQFTDMSLGGPTSWSWDFGDGTSDTVQNPAHTYQDEGTYTVILTATSRTGSATVSRLDYIVVEAEETTTATATATTTVTTTTASSVSSLLAAFNGSPRSGPAPLTVVFTDTTVGTPVTWLWDFGDGASETVQNPVHAYKKVGTYTVTLTVNSSGAGKTIKQVDFITVSSPYDSVLPEGTSSGSQGNSDQVRTKVSTVATSGGASGQGTVGKGKTPTPTLTGKAWLEYEKQRMAEVDTLATNQTSKDIISQIIDFFKGLIPFLK